MKKANTVKVCEKQKHPIFNNEYEILKSLGEGNTSKVYLGRSIQDPAQKIAIKIFREEFLSRDQNSIKSIEQEIQILKGLKHKKIVDVLGYGSDGIVKKPSGREIQNLVYITLEYVEGGLLFDLCQTVGGMGEDGGRFFLHQMVEAIDFIHGKGVVHRDLKLENILVKDDLTLKIADFGFSTYKKITKLKSYRGTMTYMAPEIKEGKVYDGKQIDVFSIGVILFIIVQGIFPFKEAKPDEYFYNLLIKGKIDTYWKKVGGESLSKDFKELVLRMVHHDPSKRPSISEIKKNPWFLTPFSQKLSRTQILEKLQEKRDQKTASTSNDDEDEEACRACLDPMLELVREPLSEDVAYRFNDMRDHEIEVSPGNLMETLQRINCDYLESKLKIEANIEKQYLKIATTDESELEVKIKFFAVPPSDEADEDYEEDEEDLQNQRLRVSFIKKKGDLSQWYEIFKELSEAGLDQILQGPESHYNEQSITNSISENNDSAGA